MLQIFLGKKATPEVMNLVKLSQEFPNIFKVFKNICFCVSFLVKIYVKVKNFIKLYKNMKVYVKLL